MGAVAAVEATVEAAVKTPNPSFSNEREALMNYASRYTIKRLAQFVDACQGTSWEQPARVAYHRLCKWITQPNFPIEEIAPHMYIIQQKYLVFGNERHCIDLRNPKSTTPLWPRVVARMVRRLQETTV